MGTVRGEIIVYFRYSVLLEYHKCVFSPLTRMVGPIMNLISRTYHSCERRKYVFMILRKYLIIFPERGSESKSVFANGKLIQVKYCLVKRALTKQNKLLLIYIFYYYYDILYSIICR